jgi:NAD(P)-dependent dehydrogenase (short-subunit alcohol dehydrogenase family)
MMVLSREEIITVDLGLAGRVALVTGASGGIGAAIARAFAAEGANVALGYHTGRTAVDEVAGRIEQAGAEALVVQHDLSEPDTIRAAVAAVRAAWGRLDALVTGAWLAPGWLPPDTTPESVPARSWQDQLRVNVEGTAATVRAVLPAMRERQWGRIVLLSSGAADGSPGMEHYAAAKAALRGLSRSLAGSAGPAGILTNIVMPGLIPTARHRRIIPAAALAGWAAETPTRRLATEQDVAAATVFLASAANGSTTGTEVRVDGGRRG